MAMLRVEQIAATLGRKYLSNRGFFELCRPENYPYEVSLNPPNSKQLLNEFPVVRQWQQSYEQSPWAGLLVKESFNHRVLGEQKIITKLRFNNPAELEDFVRKYLPKKELALMVNCNLQDFGGPTVRLGTFKAFYTLCQMVAQPLHPSLMPISPAYPRRFKGVQYFMAHQAHKAAMLGEDLLIALQFVDFFAATPDIPCLYLRQFSLPHMHTKFVEQNYVLVDQLLTYCLPPNRQRFAINPIPPELADHVVEERVSQQSSEPDQLAHGTGASGLSDATNAAHFANAQGSDALKTEGESGYATNNAADSQGVEVSATTETKVSSGAGAERNESPLPDSQPSNHQEGLSINQAQGQAQASGTQAGLLAQVESQSAFKSASHSGSQAVAQETAQDTGTAVQITDSVGAIEAEIANMEAAFQDEVSGESGQDGKPWQRFLLRWGFKLKPDMVRLRSLDPEHVMWLDDRQGFQHVQGYDMSLSVEALNAWQAQASMKHVLICENEICYLSLPPISHTIAIWGSGYKAAILGRVGLLCQVDVVYWGDLDTHGFAILNQLRFSAGPQAKIRSMLMDIPTLERNLKYAVTEKRPYAGKLDYLTPVESSAYAALNSRRFGHNLRLEQELIPFDQLLDALRFMLPEEHIIVPKNFGG